MGGTKSCSETSAAAAATAAIEAARARRRGARCMREVNPFPLRSARVDHGIDLGAFLLAFAVALIGAKVFGALAERVGQPAVLGELVAGIVLGPSLLGLVPLSAGIYLLAEIGVLLLLFEVGLETDLEELLAVG